MATMQYDIWSVTPEADDDFLEQMLRLPLQDLCHFYGMFLVLMVMDIK